MKYKKENYFINDDGLCVCVMNGTEHDSVWDTLSGHYTPCYGIMEDDFDEDGCYKEGK